MIQKKLKICDKCLKPKIIWKTINGKKYCQYCTNLKIEKKSIPKVNEKRIIKDKQYKSLRLKLLKEHPICQAKLTNCTIFSTECHHKRGRVGKYYLDYSTFLAVCHNCHITIEKYPILAKELGLSESRLNK